MENFTLNNKKVSNPIEWAGVEITADFKGVGLNAVQPQLSVQNFTFVNDSKCEILEFQENNGVFKQLPMSFNIGQQTFQSYLKNFNYLLDRNKIIADAQGIDNMEGLSVLLDILTSDMLDYPSDKLGYAVEKIDLNPELISLGLYFLTYSYILYTQIKDFQDYISRGTEAFTPVGAPPLPNFGAIIAYVLEGIALITFLAVTVVQLVKTLKELKDLVISKKQNAKCITMFDLMRVPLEYLGYTFESNIEELKQDEIWSSGHDKPVSGDICYRSMGVFNFAESKYNGLFWVKDKVVHFHHEEDDFWNKTSDFVLPNVQLGNYKLNTNEIIGSRLINYSVDYNDKHTLNNFKGNEYLTTVNIDDVENSTVTGYSETNYGVSRATRKKGLNAVENKFNQLAKLASNTIKLFGGDAGNIEIDKRIGIAIISEDDFSVAKMVRVKNGKLPSNIDTVISAKYDEENYHWSKSFVRNPKRKQKIYENIVCEYCKDDFIKNIDSKYFSTTADDKGEFDLIKWNNDRDRATIDFRVSHNYKTNLKEEFYESIR